MINNSSNVRKPQLRSKVWIQLPPGPTLVFKMKLKILVLQQKGKQLTAAQPQKIQRLLATAVAKECRWLGSRVRAMLCAWLISQKKKDGKSRI